MLTETLLDLVEVQVVVVGTQALAEHQHRVKVLLAVLLQHLAVVFLMVKAAAVAQVKQVKRLNQEILLVLVEMVYK